MSVSTKRSLAAKKAWVTRRAKKKKMEEAKQSKKKTTFQEVKKRVNGRQSCREVFRSEILHVVEYSPQIRVCKFDHCHRPNERRHLAMPYMQFTRYLGKQGLSLHVSFTNKPLKDISQNVFFPPLPNVWYPSLQVCLMNCPNHSFDAVINDFWNTQYLDCEDWYAYPVLDKETPMRTYLRWERMTRQDPAFILNVEWTHPCRLDKIPLFDLYGDLSHGTSGKPEYGGSGTNRRDGPIREFAVVPYCRGNPNRKLD